jgi:gluconate 2-dehydrogenase alpha chain
MATRLKPVDVVFVGVGWTASIIGRELAGHGLNCVGLERGRWRDTVPDFQSPGMHDELAYAVRVGLMQDTARETVTVRNTPDEEALPMRQLGSFLPGINVGGAGVHWNGQVFRFLPDEFRFRSHNEERYGKAAIAEDLTIQDWPVTYDELEPHYTRFEHLCGIGGQVGNLNGKKVEGGSPFEGWRSKEFPNPPMTESYSGALFAKAAKELGYSPFPVPSANMTRTYTNPEGLTLQPCAYCGFCERFGCEHYAKASPQTTVLPKVLETGKFDLRTGAHVTRVLWDKDAKRATGVSYVDLATGAEMEQPADIVILSAWAYHNARLMLLSGIGQPYDPKSGEGQIGRNYAYQTMSAVNVFYDEDVNINPFMGAGALGTAIDDFSGDNFDHSKLGFIGGAYVTAYVTGGRPIQFHPTPPGTPRWGLDWKKAVARSYNHTVPLSIHGNSMASRTNYLSLDPTWRDAFGQPLARITFDFPENDMKMPPTSQTRSRRSPSGWVAVRCRRWTARSPTASCPTRRRTTRAARSWAPTRRTARRTDTGSPGICRTSSCRARRSSLRITPTTRPTRWGRSPTGPRPRSATSI